jgi:hypothetical protein
MAFPVSTRTERQQKSDSQSHLHLKVAALLTASFSAPVIVGLAWSYGFASNPVALAIVSVILFVYIVLRK